MPSEGKVEKRKRVNLTVAQKLELIEKLESGASVKWLCEAYGVKNQTISDIRKTKSKLTEYTVKYSLDGYSSKSGSLASRKHMKVGSQKELDEAVYKWYVKQKSCGTTVTSANLRNACEQLSKHLGIQCSASNGWLWRFRNRHGLRDTQVKGEAGRADRAGVDVYRVKLNERINNTSSPSMDRNNGSDESDQSLCSNVLASTSTRPTNDDEESLSEEDILGDFEDKNVNNEGFSPPDCDEQNQDPLALEERSDDEAPGVPHVDIVSEARSALQFARSLVVGDCEGSKEEAFGRFVASELQQIKDASLYNRTKWRIQVALKDGLEEQDEHRGDPYPAGARVPMGSSCPTAVGTFDDQYPTGA